MTSFNLGVCVSPSMLWPPSSVRAETAEQAKSTAPQFVEFIIDHFPDIFGDDAVCVLGMKSEIVVDTPVANSGSESETLASDESCPRSTSLHHSDSSLYKVATDRDNNEQPGTLLTVKETQMSKSTPSSPVHQRKKHDRDESDISRKIHTAFYHPKHSPRPGRRRSDQSSTSDDVTPTKPQDTVSTNRTLTSITTSAELIEHVPSTEEISKKHSSGSSPLTSRYGPEPAMLKKTSLPKREVLLQLATSQSFYTATSHVAERAHCVDRRRQPAAPSYQEHMQRQRNNNLPTLKVQIPETSGNETPTGNKSTETKIGLALSPVSTQTLDAFTADSYFMTGCSSCSNHVSPVSSERSVPSKLSTGSETSISSLSSNDECLDADATTTSSEEKPDVTRLKHIRELLDVSGYTNPLRISPETADMISRIHGDWGELGAILGDECSEMDDYQRMTMAEETYV